jgi:hypothetical protein
MLKHLKSEDDLKVAKEGFDFLRKHHLFTSL